MSLDHFGLNEPPFRITPHTDFFFAGANRGATLEALLYAIGHEEGIIKITGEARRGGSDGRRTPVRLRALEEDLSRRYAAGKRVVVLIDEAHAMPLETLEELRLLSNLGSNRPKLLHIVRF